MSKYDMRDIRRFCEENNFKNVDRFRNYELYEDLAKVDERMAKVICRDILNGNESNSPLENMEAFFVRQGLSEDSPEKADLNFKDLEYNSYPFVRTSDNLYSRFIGICWPKTKLDDVLKEALGWAERRIKEFDHTPYEDASAFILTYKWDAKKFRKYEEQFLEYASYGIWFVFILVTDYGYVQIPFLPNNRDLTIDLPRHKKDVLKFDSPIIYTVSNVSLGYESISTFDLKKKKWTVKESRNGQYDTKNGKIAPDRIREFNEYMKNIDFKNIEDNISGSMDGTRYSLLICGRKILWDTPADNIYPYSHLGDVLHILMKPALGM